MPSATDNELNARYNDEVLFLDGIVEFHPEAIAGLSAEDRRVLGVYYGLGQPTPENIFAFRQELSQTQPDIETQAKAVFAKVLASLHIDEFHYTTQTD